MAKLLGFETKETRTVTLKIGEDKIPAKLHAKNLLPSNMASLQDAYAEAQEHGKQEKKLTREIKVLNKKFEEQLNSETATAEESDATRQEIEAKEQKLETLQTSMQELLDRIEDWNLSTVADIDLVEPRPDLTDAELEELAALEAAGKLEVSSPLVQKIKFDKESMRKLTNDIRRDGLISYAPLTLFGAITEAAQVKKTKSSGSQGR